MWFAMDYYRGVFGGNIAFSYLKKKAIVTVAIIVINVAVFAIATILGLHQWTILRGGMVPLSYIIHTGEYWRFLTSMFIHGNLLHMVFNMIILMHGGGFIEPQMGWKRFLAFYLSAGLLVSFFTGVLSQGISVGASGALFAVLGYILYYDLQARKRGIQTHSMIVPLVLVNIVFTFLIPRVSIVGHFSGLAVGYLYGWLKGRMKI